MKKLFTVIATFTFIIALEISPCLAESREQDCGSNKHRAEHTSELTTVETERVTCTQHSNCIVTIRYMQKAWRCSVCCYRTYDPETKETYTHNMLNRSIE